MTRPAWTEFVSMRERMDRESRQPSPFVAVTSGQTEPLAALVAVTALCLAVSVYAGFVTGLVPELGSDRELASVTGERVWGAVSEDGVYPARTELQSTLSEEDLPQGRYVSVNVTYVDSHGTLRTASEVHFDELGSVRGPVDPPSGAETFERPIPVKHREGDVRPGTLTVVVWDE